MIRKSVQRFSERIMLKQQPKARRRLIPNLIALWSHPGRDGIRTGDALRLS
jgi:hypothetical protein